MTMPKIDLTIPPISLSRPVRLALEWLSSSGIQNANSNLKSNGGVNAWFDLKTKTYPFIYSEITGYAVNIFLFFHQLTENSGLLARALQAGDWLIEASDPGTGLPYNRVYETSDHESYYDSWVFTFDEWVIIYGLANLYGTTGERRYLDHAEKMAQFLFDKTFLSNGSMYPVFNLASAKPEATNDKWSRQTGSFHAKALLGLNRLFELTGREEYFARALWLRRAVLTFQKEDGRFVTQTNENSTHLHPHLYTLEGLFYFGLNRGDTDLISRAERGLEWVLGAIGENGSLYSFYKNGGFAPYERADILAQTLRLAAIQSQRTDRFEPFQKNLSRLRERLLSYQIKEGPQKGGFLYGKEQDGTTHEHANAWVTMFAAQALSIDEFRRTSNKKYDFSFFV